MCHCECKSDHGNFKTNKNTSEKVNCSSLIFGLFFSFDTDSNGHPIDNGKPTSALRLVNSERHRNWTALSNAHFQYRGSIEYHDTWDGIVIVAAISVIAQHYWWGRPTPRPISLTDISETAQYFIKCESAKMWSEWQEFKMWNFAPQFFAFYTLVFCSFAFCDFPITSTENLHNISLLFTCLTSASACPHFTGGHAANLPNRYSVLCWRPAMHAQTWASYSTLYRFGRLSGHATVISVTAYFQLGSSHLPGWPVFSQIAHSKSNFCIDYFYLWWLWLSWICEKLTKIFTYIIIKGYKRANL